MNRWKPTRESDESTVYAELVVETGPAAGDIRGWTHGPPSRENRTAEKRPGHRTAKVIAWCLGREPLFFEKQMSRIFYS